MNRLIRYTLRNEFLKLSTYLTPILGIMLYIGLTYAQVFGKFSQTNVSFIETGNAYAFITIFAISIIFVAIKVASIFRQPHDNGLDVIYASKPISAKGRTFSKFISVWVLIIYFSVLFLLASIICGVMDSRTTGMEVFNYSISIFIGNITILFAASSIFIILSTFVGQRTILIIGTMISVFAPSFSIVVSQTLKAKMPRENLLPAYMKASKNLEDITKNDANLYSTRKNTLFINNPKVFVPNFKAKYDIYKQHTVYRQLAYVDPWYQFSSIYDVTYESQFAKDGKNWVESTKVFHRRGDQFTVDIAGQKYTPLISNRILSNQGNLKIESLSSIANTNPNSNGNSLSYLGEVSKVSAKFNKWSFVKQMIFVGATYNKANINDRKEIAKLLFGTSNSGIVNKIDNLTENQAISVYNNGRINFTDNAKIVDVIFDIDIYTLLAWQLMISIQDINQYTHLKNPLKLGLNDRYGASYDIILAKEGDVMPVIIPKDFINKTGVYIFWALVAFGLVILSMVIISKRDSH